MKMTLRNKYTKEETIIKADTYTVEENTLTFNPSGETFNLNHFDIVTFGFKRNSIYCQKIKQHVKNSACFNCALWENCPGYYVAKTTKTVFTPKEEL